MPRNNWLLVIALWGGVATPALSQAPAAQAVPKAAPMAKSQAAKAPDNKQYPTLEAPLPVRVVETPEDSKHTREREARSDKHDADDLVAQVRAANAVEKQVTPTYVAAWLSGIGTILLIATLSITEVERRHNKQSNERQLRAYVGIKPIKHKILKPAESESGSREFQTRIAIKNYGQTPAYNLSFAHEAWIPERTPDMGADRLEWQVSDNVLNPGQVRYAHMVTPLSEGEEDALMEGHLRVMVVGKITYTDAFNEPRFTDFSLKINKRVFRIGKHIYSVAGNKSS